MDGPFLYILICLALISCLTENDFYGVSFFSLAVTVSFRLKERRTLKAFADIISGTESNNLSDAGNARVGR